MRTIVYVDAFNLYYDCLRKSPYKWLDLAQLSRILLPHNQIEYIKYFTARVGARPSDPDQPTRQQLYLRALATLGPRIEIYYGHYLSHVVKMPLAFPPSHGPRFAEVIKTEEKGSDVNLATQLISDAYEDRFQVAALITNDSDLLGPVQLVTERLRKRVGILNPQQHPSVVLKQAATFFKKIRESALRQSQFPDELVDSIGTFRKPLRRRRALTS
jgi:hypothetical protein